MPSLLFHALVAALPLGVQSGNLMRRDRGQSLDTIPDLAASMMDVLKDVPAQRLISVEASVRQTFEAFPKNAQGQIPQQGIFASIVRSYFSKEHGWLIKGLEPPSMRPFPVTEVHEAIILKEKVPSLVDVLKEFREADRGIALSDIVAVIAAMEHLVLEEAAAILRGAYRLNGWAAADQMDETALHDVLRSYVILFRQGDKRELNNFRLHTRMKALARNNSAWPSLVKFEHDAVREHGFLEDGYAFRDALQMAEDLTMKYGKFQNAECTAMKADLMSLDPEGTGRVPLDLFHAQPAAGKPYEFTETAEYLRNSHALDEEDPASPKVLIANYVLGPSNCIASSGHFSVCCLTECTGLMSELEGRLRLPSASPQELFDMVNDIAGANPRYHLLRAPEILSEELYRIAKAHDGSVPLHSSEFLVWLHRAFPDECPYPTDGERADEDAESLAAERWLSVQQGQCTRLPQWQTMAEKDKGNPPELDFV